MFIVYIYISSILHVDIHIYIYTPYHIELDMYMLYINIIVHICISVYKCIHIYVHTHRHLLLHFNPFRIDRVYQWPGPFLERKHCLRTGVTSRGYRCPPRASLWGGMSQDAEDDVAVWLHRSRVGDE